MSSNAAPPNSSVALSITAGNPISIQQLRDEYNAYRLARGPANLNTLNDDVILRLVETPFRPSSAQQCETLSQQDILNVRITCRALSKNLIRWFRNELPRLRNGKPEQFRRFSAISNAEVIANQITKLHINVAEFNSGGLRNLMRHSDAAGRYGKMFLQDIRDTAVPLLEKGDFTDDFHEDRHLRYQQAYIEEEWMKASEDLNRLFTKAFSKLPALTEITIGEWTLAHHDTHGSRPSEYMLPHAETFGCSARTAALRSLLENLARHPKAALEQLVVQQDAPAHRSSFDLSDEEAGIWAFDLPPPVVLDTLALSTTNLTTLHLALGDGTFIPDGRTTTSTMAPAGSAPDQAAQRALVAFVSACPHMQTFSLAAAKNTFFPSSLIGAVLAALPESLRGIHLHNVLAASTDLAKFFWERRGGLRAVGLSRVYLDVDGDSASGSWTPLFKLVKDHVLGLEAVRFEQLWELHAAAGSATSKKLCFAAVPDGGVGGGYGRRAGMFVEGRFVPGGRYDSLTFSGESERFDDELGREAGWEAESVQECLAMAIWGAEREEGARVWDVPLPERIVGYLRELAGEKDEGECDEDGVVADWCSSESVDVVGAWDA
ncbi:hypothetical protein SLS58_011112 [Diplodia intermedia]|uniref:F-box domain-containing protein n=1 Tax=Diplodia intermedia TaxID=856260 RepID=A0ABR3T1F4_9PEZI